jgi:hypothetical protein
VLAQGAELKGIKYVKEVLKDSEHCMQVMYWSLFQDGELTNWLDQKLSEEKISNGAGPKMSFRPLFDEK